ncbi:MAG: T9SS type A sorting domain-containing protein [Bacteroidia bacterium]|nr:T9SS type A sorting domain-containing protein [Bacteroidia bacterium]
MRSFQNKASFLLNRSTVAVALFFISGSFFAQIPLLNSRPSNTTQVIYLDFDGHVTSGTSWNSGALITALPSTISYANMVIVWKRMSEDYIPFDVNITTDSARFNAAPANKRMRIVVTPSSAWYSNNAGGVAYVGSFAWGGTPGTPCWVFENQLGYSAKNIAEAASHEGGHTLSLRHQSTYSITPSSTCTKTAEYNPGQGTGVTGWAPIMGVGYSKNVTTWYNGTSAVNCNTLQLDHGNSLPGITGTNFLSFYPDDVGNALNSGKVLDLNTTALVDSGLISTPSDIDVFSFSFCTNRYISIDVKPWALDTTSYSGANLDVNLVLRDAVTNSVIASDAQINRLNARLAANLTPGSYYFTIDGDGSANYSDYGSLGRYYVSIKTTNAPQFTNTIVTNSLICQNKPTTLSYTSNGVPSSFQWNISGPTSMSTTVQFPSVTFSSTGVYTITFFGQNNFVSCPVTKTITVNPSPSFSLTQSQIFCKDATVSLVANPVSGNTYTWMPGNLSGASQVFSPAQTTQYTVTAGNGLCTNTAVTSLSLSPDFTLSIVASNTLFCPGDTVSISASGASNYTFMPGGQSVSQITLTPVTPVVYTIYAANLDGCIKQDSVSLNLKECNPEGVEEYQLENEISVFPNPANASVYLAKKSTSNVTNVQVLNSLGQVISEFGLKNEITELKTDNLANGLYFLRIFSKRNSLVRFVVSH